MSTKARPTVEGEAKEPLIYRNMLLLFIVLVCCFTAWGVAADLTTPMVAGFKRIFEMSTFQASLVQLAYYGAYFLLALPAAFINERFGYKAGILTGLGLAAVGAFAFYPASKIMTYSAFLVALFAMAAGCSILETSANPFVISLGPEGTATRRLNLAQAFNPLGTNIGVLLAATLILPNLQDPVNLASLTSDQLHTIRAGELGAVMGPYLGLAFVLLLLWLSVLLRKAPPIATSSRLQKPRGRAEAPFSGSSWATGVTGTESSRSSSTSRPRSAPGPSSSCTSSRPSAAAFSSAATCCRSA